MSDADGPEKGEHPRPGVAGASCWRWSSARRWPAMQVSLSPADRREQAQRDPRARSRRWCPGAPMPATRGTGSAERLGLPGPGRGRQTQVGWVDPGDRAGLRRPDRAAHRRSIAAVEQHHRHLRPRPEGDPGARATRSSRPRWREQFAGKSALEPLRGRPRRPARSGQEIIARHRRHDLLRQRSCDIVNATVAELPRPACVAGA